MNNKKKIKILALPLIIIAVALSIYIYKIGGISCFTYKVYGKTLYRTRDLKKDRITFLGDSIVDMCNLDALFNKKINNEGVCGNTTNDILNRLDSTLKFKPSVLFLHFGINDLKQMKGHIVNINKSISNYNLIIKKIKEKLPNTKVYIESVLPVDNSTIARIGKTKKIYDFYISNKDITAFNMKLEELAKKYNITYIKHNNFNPSAEAFDGMHPSTAGYFTLKKDLQKYTTEQ